MKSYIDLVKKILNKGIQKKDRTGTGVLSVFGTQTRYDLQKGFPLLTTKKIFFSSVIHELLWFLKGSTNISNLSPHTKIWDPWADEKNELGPIYGYQWRFWEKFVLNPQSKTYEKTHIDQIKTAIKTIKINPQSRRIIVSAWNVADLDKMALPPCHSFFQFSVMHNRLDCQIYQRSADVAIGVPFNIASYALLLTMFAMECSLTPGVLIHTIGDAHLYLNHVKKIKEQIQRPPLKLPDLKIKKTPFFDITFEDISIQNYQHHPFIKFDISV